MKRILLIVAIALGVAALTIFYIIPVALSFYAARRAEPVTRVVPVELSDHTISQARGMRLSYVGYEFDVPWEDLDDSKTQLYPTSKAEKTMAVLVFRSGLKLEVSSLHPREFAALCATEFKLPAANIDAVFGQGSSTSDYVAMKNVYAFTPDKMHHWSLTPRVFARETVLLITKSLMPSRPARSGVFNVQTGDYRGFQQGNLNLDRKAVIISLFANDGGVELIFDAEHCTNPAGLTQPEINRVVQTFRKARPSESSSSPTATSS